VVLVDQASNESLSKRSCSCDDWHIARYAGDGGGSMHSIVKSKEEIDVKDVAEFFK
jgi:hypothetical protein